MDFIYTNSSIGLAQYLAERSVGIFDTYREKFEKTKAKPNEMNIHDFRVAVRRLLVLMGLCERFVNSPYLKYGKQISKDQFKQLSRIRDLDVMKIRTKHIAKTFPEMKDFFDFLSKKRKKLKDSFEDIFDPNKMSDMEGVFFFFRFDILPQISQSNHNFDKLIRLTDERYESLIRAANEISDNDVSTIHTTRISLKKFRYIYEIVYPSLRNKPNLLKDLVGLQNLMGELQDIEVYSNEFIKYLDKYSRLSDFVGVFGELLFEKKRILEKFASGKSKIDYLWK